MTGDAVIRAMVDVERFRAALTVDPEVLHAYLRAEGYAWGYQDARGPTAFDTDQATAFARTYAIAAAEFHTGTRSSYPPLLRAWLDHGDIEPTAPGGTS
ncbi:hypothetical protein [Nocardia transvalensis]|uniref:hypothetical protein n=1 Tax=Nocardia transvalensis TaxID=37333 RepID=UPI001895E30E|nr:hypothetical protein [Nocardia transvalensis]MBF6328433.1 hypothetical protein [Nocardia transvalensis]